MVQVSIDYSNNFNIQLKMLDEYVYFNRIWTLDAKHRTFYFLSLE